MGVKDLSRYKYDIFLLFWLLSNIIYITCNYLFHTKLNHNLGRLGISWSIPAINSAPLFFISLLNKGSKNGTAFFIKDLSSAINLDILVTLSMNSLTIGIRNELYWSSLPSFNKYEKTNASSMPKFIPLPPMGTWTWAASPAKNTLPMLILFAWRLFILKELFQKHSESLSLREEGICF